MRAHAAPVVPLGTVSAAATRAVQWAARCWPPGEAHGPALAVEALALVQLGRAVGAGPCPAGVALEQDIARTFPDLQWTTGQLWVSLLAATGARARLPALAPDAGAYLDALGELADEGCLDGPAATLTHVARHGTPPAAMCGAEQDIGPPSSVRARLLETLGDIETATGFGCVPVSAAPHAGILLEGAAMAALRTYDLPFAMRILRARAYLDDEPSAGLAAGLDYLRLLQCDDGSFGDFDAALRQIAVSGGEDGDLRLKLPVTLHAIWTIAELEDPDFRLIRHGFTPNAPQALGDAHAVQRAT